MGWLPTVLLLVVGLLVLVLLAVALVGAVHRARRASDRLTTALTGRTSRVRAGVAELTAWRAARRGPRAPGDGA
ncbi:MAG TPA: hypothetical protein VGH99_11270 [Pseudonocardia sp.]|jgi:hypothetical protein